MSLRSLRTPLARSQRPSLLVTRLIVRSASKTTSEPSNSKSESKTTTQNIPQEQPKKHKTQAEIDEELRKKMSGLSGDGGESGVEYEDGQPVAMKRSVKSNMFRYI